jgi:hypothetical protein
MHEIVLSPGIEAKELFIAKKINSRLNFLNLKLEDNQKNKNDYKNDRYKAFGIYFMFFKKKLIYIGSWCGNGLEAKDSVVKERWRKHIITVTTRFLDINFGGNSSADKKKYQERLYDKIKEKIINKLKLSRKKNLRDHDYQKSFEKKKIYKDIIQEILSINSQFEKDYIKILHGGHICSSHNRFKFSSKNWDYLKNCNEDNILNDFQFNYYKFENLFNFVDKKFKDKNNLYFNKNGKKHIKKKIQEIFENPLIEEFNPEANDQYNPNKSCKKFIFNSSNDEIIIKLKKLFIKQSLTGFN